MPELVRVLLRPGLLGIPSASHSLEGAGPKFSYVSEAQLATSNHCDYLRVPEDSAIGVMKNASTFDEAVSLASNEHNRARTT